ncbi:nucleotidyl transferase AbiEii/AbiGii toxin family protein [Candidatus Pacearchaeota archaeon]|nr:nucleotidyl transferase AbiEii/AbiGii toxin family protein [Candidatus Pacearchaeota archaeon]
MISKEELLRAGKHKGLNNKEHIEKNYFQDVFLFNLYRKTNIFVFKGGTALYKLYNLPRFSEDLDFSLVEEIDGDKIKKIIYEVTSESDFFSIKDIKKNKGFSFNKDFMQRDFNKI